MKAPVIHTTFLLVVFSLAFVCSCGKDEVLPEGELTILDGDNQTGIKGEFLTDPVIIKVASRFSPDEIVLTGVSLNGNGEVAAELSESNGVIGGFKLDENYEAEIYLRLDCDLDSETFEIYLRNKSCLGESDCPVIGSTQINTSGMTGSGTWKNECQLENIIEIQEYNGEIYVWSSNTPFLSFPNLPSTTYSMLRKTTDFESWITVTERNDQVVDFQITPDGTMYIQSSNGIQTSTNGVDWLDFDAKLRDNYLYIYADRLLAEDSAVFMNLGEEGLFKTTDNGESWESIYFSSGISQLTRADNGDLYLYDEELQALMRSSDYGASWETASFQGNIQGDVKRIVRGINNDLFIVSGEFDYFNGTGSAYLYSLDLNTSQLNSISLSGSLELNVNDITVKDGIVYILSNNNVYRSMNNWEMIEGPELAYPRIDKLFFTAFFDDLYVKGPDEFLLYGFENYSNFID